MKPVSIAWLTTHLHPRHAKELDVSYEMERYECDAESQAPAALLAVNPLGKSPIISDKVRYG